MTKNAITSDAINSFDKFTKSQKSILSIIIQFLDEDDRANISVKSITEISGFTKAIIYRSLSKLENEGYIIREKEYKKQVGYIKLNKSSFNEVIEFYKKKQQLINT